MAAREYMADGKASNSLLEYLQSLEPHNLAELTACAGDDVLEAMNSFIQRLLGAAAPAVCHRCG
jgi:Protein of unknown function (DUF760)